MPEKILVAVRGIGEQLRGETIRSVAAQLCRYCGQPASLPLGRFGAIQVAAEQANAAQAAGAAPVFAGAFLVHSPPDPAYDKYETIKETLAEHTTFRGDKLDRKASEVFRQLAHEEPPPQDVRAFALRKTQQGRQAGEPRAAAGGSAYQNQSSGRCGR